MNAADWYAARAGGMVAYVLITLVVLVGLALSGKERLDGWPRFALEEVHRFGGALVGVFVSLHILTLALDSQAHLPLGSLIVPFVSSYRPFWTGLGIVTAELLLALAVANALRKRIGYRTWRRLHYLNFAVWIGATAHGIGAGTDTGVFSFMAVYIASIVAVVALTARRIARTAAPAREADASPREGQSLKGI